MSKIVRISGTKCNNSIVLAIDNKLYSRTIGDVTWDLLNEFECNIKTIDYSLKIGETYFPTLFVLLENGEIFYSITLGEEWLHAKLPDPTIQYFACSKYENTIINDELYVLQDRKIKIYEINKDTFNLKNEFTVNNVKEIYGRNKGLYYIDFYDNNKKYSFFNQRIDKELNKIDIEIKSCYKCFISNNDNIIYCNNGKFITENPENFLKNEDISNNIFSNSDICDLLVMSDENIHIYLILLVTGELFIGNPKFKLLKKVWQPNDNIDDLEENVQYDEITDMINLIANKSCN